MLDSVLQMDLRTEDSDPSGCPVGPEVRRAGQRRSVSLDEKGQRLPGSHGCDDAGFRQWLLVQTTQKDRMRKSKCLATLVAFFIKLMGVGTSTSNTIFLGLRCLRYISLELYPKTWNGYMTCS